MAGLAVNGVIFWASGLEWHELGLRLSFRLKGGSGQIFQLKQ